MPLYFEMLCLSIISIFAVVRPDGASDWTYEGQHGPVWWRSHEKWACNGAAQSPINIDTDEAVYHDALEPPTLIMNSVQKSKRVPFQLKNNGHTVVITYPDVYDIKIRIGQSDFCLKQNHFHWGSVDDVGSEHKLDGRASPIENHIVTWNCRLYGSFEEAAKSPDGLAVFGILYKIDESGEGNTKLLNKITKHFNSISSAGNTTEIKPFNIKMFFSGIDVGKYFRYRGSLTTPPCTQNVLWTLFADKAVISEKQLEKFRSLKDMRGSPLVNNYRPVQPLISNSSVSFIRTVAKSFD